MSLDLDTNRKKWVTRVAADIIDNSFPIAGDFPVGEIATSHMLIATYDTSAGDIVLTPAAIVGVEEGDKLMLQKVSTDTNTITYTDASGQTYAFINAEWEYGSLVWNGTGWDTFG